MIVIVILIVIAIAIAIVIVIVVIIIIIRKKVCPNRNWASQKAHQCRRLSPVSVVWSD